MYSKKAENIKIFNDTLAQIAKDPKLQESVKYSYKNQVFYSDASSIEYFKNGRKQSFDAPAKTRQIMTLSRRYLKYDFSVITFCINSVFSYYVHLCVE